MKRAGDMHRKHGQPDRSGRRPGFRPGEVEHGKTWPPISARGCAGSACGDPTTSTIEVANRMITSG